MRQNKFMNWGILGTGWVAQRFIADLQNTPSANVVAIASRSRTRVEEIASKFRIAKGYASYDEIFRDDKIDIIYVASEHQEHANHCVRALAAGKHVLCEKPFALNLSETKDVVDAARASNRFCMEAMWSRFLPGMLKTKQQIESGRIGTPKFMSLSFGSPVVESTTSRFFDPLKGGGALLDRGVYGVSLATWFFGKPKEIFAIAELHSSGVDKGLTIVLTFPDDVTAVITASFVAYLTNDATISGTTGRLTLEEPFYRPERLRISQTSISDPSQHSEFYPTSIKERLRRIVARAKPYVPMIARFRSRTNLIPVQGFGYGYEAYEVMRCIEEGLSESPIMPLRDTLLVAEVMDVVRDRIKR
jgi:predicted dehydrogenase